MWWKNSIPHETKKKIFCKFKSSKSDELKSNVKDLYDLFLRGVTLSLDIPQCYSNSHLIKKRIKACYYNKIGENKIKLHEFFLHLKYFFRKAARGHRISVYGNIEGNPEDTSLLFWFKWGLHLALNDKVYGFFYRFRIQCFRLYFRLF